MLCAHAGSPGYEGDREGDQLMEPDDAWDEYCDQLEEMEREDDRRSDDFRCYWCEVPMGRGGYCLKCRDEMDAHLRGNARGHSKPTNQ